MEFCRHELPISLHGPTINLTLLQTLTFPYCLASLYIRHMNLLSVTIWQGSQESGPIVGQLQPQKAPYLSPQRLLELICSRELGSTVLERYQLPHGTRLFGAKKCPELQSTFNVAWKVSHSSLCRLGTLSTQFGLLLLQEVSHSGSVLFRELGQSV